MIPEVARNQHQLPPSVNMVRLSELEAYANQAKYGKFRKVKRKQREVGLRETLEMAAEAKRQ